MLHLLSPYDGGAASRRQLLAGLDQHLRAVVDSKGRGDLDQVARAETAVLADPARALRFSDSGHATLHAGGRRYQAGRFEIPHLCALHARALRARGARAARGAGTERPAARLRLFVLEGASPATDIGALQATAPPASLFQVASQFNCLESPGRFVTPVSDYVHDPTQGPRASISAFPGTLVRHYAAPLDPGADPLSTGRFAQQTDGPQLNLLGDVCAEDIAAVRSGYLRPEDIADPAAFARALCDLFGAVRVGLHDGVEVVLGHDWDGAVAGAPHRTIAQVFCSTIAAGLYGDLDPKAGGDMSLICRQLQRAAYFGTLLSAAALGKEHAVLTLIGGGVFGNPLPVIWEAILWAADQVEPLLHQDLQVVVNGRNLGEDVPIEHLHAAAQARGGTLIRFDRAGASLPAD